MTTYLNLCKDLVREAGITSSSGTGPSAVTSQTGEMLRVVNWVRKAWDEIQNRHSNSTGLYWRWMRRQFTLALSSGDDTYAYGDATDVDASAAIARFSCWFVNDLKEPPRCYLTASGVSAEYWLHYVPLEAFNTIYKKGSGQSGTPIHITVDEKNQLLFGPKPNASFTVTGDFLRSVQTLAADGDIPEMPTQYHDLIVWYALEHYGFYEVAPEAIRRAQRAGGRLMRQLEINQLPELDFAEPMA